MSIKGIKIANFKSFGEAEQYIQFAPLTMLFGQNSAGKSSIFQAMGLIHEILNSGNVNPKSTSHSKRELGGFEAYVHNKDKHKDVMLGLVLEDHESSMPGLIGKTFLLGNYPGDPNAFKNPLFLDGELYSDSMLGELRGIRTAEIRFTIGYTTLNGAPRLILKKYELILDEQLLLSITEPGYGGYLSYLSIDHPVILGDTEPEKVKDIIAQLIGRYTGFFKFEKVLKTQALMGCGLRNFQFTSKLDMYLSEGADESDPFYDPEFDNEDFDDFSERKSDFTYLEKYLNKLNKAVLTVAEIALENFIHIGPLRKIQPRQKAFSGSIGNKSLAWWDGSMAWEILHDPLVGSNVLATLNDWLSSPDKMGSNYQISDDVLIRLDVKRFKNISQQSSPDGRFDDLLDSANIESSISIIDTKTNTVLSQEEIGVGFSQLLPIMVAILLFRDKTVYKPVIAVEQPELHIHPELQIHLIDMILETMPKIGERTILLETHSEYMMLRVMKRLFDTHECVLQSDQHRLSSEDVAIYYVSSTDGGSQIKKLRVDDDGEFLDRWPEGFFPQRTDQLF